MTDARIVVHRTDHVAPIDRRLFGGFVEHLGRCVYDGLYEPGHPSADEHGFRTDVIDLVKELGTTTVRYPGGNFVSGYRWEDGVGPREQRPRRLDMAWHSTETNEIGTDGFATWCALTGQELMLAVNLGTRGIQAALDLLEYTNHPAGTALSNQRITNGHASPHNVRMWCLGNEMDGPWQTGHMSAEDYGTLAARTAAAMKTFDPTLELVACGSSASDMPTFGEWERVVLENTYDHVDYISCHAYYQLHDGDLGSFLASSLNMEYFIATVAATADHVGHRRKSPKTMKLSFDEWNIWYLTDHHATGFPDDWPDAPRLLEDAYTVADAVVLGSLLITLLKNHNRVAAASLAQLVNVIAPIMTEPAGPAWRQTTFYPFSTTSRLATGNVLKPHIHVCTYDTARHGTAPLVDAVVTDDQDTGTAAVFIVNRSQGEAVTVTINLSELDVTRVTETIAIHDDDPFAVNTLTEPARVTPRSNDTATITDGALTLILPPVSWTAIALATGRGRLRPDAVRS